MIDPTPFGRGSATGELKQAFFGDWPPFALLHLWEKPDHALAANIYRAESAQELEITGEADGLHQLVSMFQPEIVIYRPVGDCPTLHEAAMSLIRRLDAPLAIWVMDDWPSRLRHQNSSQYEAVEKDLCELFRRSKNNYAISERMAVIFSEHYGVAFDVARNGVEPANWSARAEEKTEKSETITIRYAGSLAPDTARDSVIDVANAVGRLRAAGLPIELEIRTQRTWFEPNKKTFDAISGVSLKLATLTANEYRKWLTDADIVLMAYNFDEATARYLSYSFANKLPELLASGAALLAYGPPGLESIRRLCEQNAAHAVTERDDALLDAEIKSLATNKDLRIAIGQKARSIAFGDYNLAAQRNRFLQRLTEMARGEVLEGADLPERAHYRFDEVLFASELLLKPGRKGVMIDVGAHHGSSLKPFAEQGWDIYAFEPDPHNRKHLVRNTRQFDTVDILPFAVSDVSQENVSFYSSKISTGISSLSPFHETHKKTATVSTTTLDALIAEEELTDVDFLKIDVEGHEMDVLNGLDFSNVKPRIIVAEFENKKSQSLGFTVDDLAEKLQRVGYHIYVSEWRPIIQYGGNHRWRRLTKYPCEIGDNAWGNLICLAEPVERSNFESAFLASLDRYAPEFEDIYMRSSARRHGLAGNIQEKLRRLAERTLVYHPRIAAVLRFGLRPARPLVRLLLGSD